MLCFSVGFSLQQLLCCKSFKFWYHSSVAPFAPGTDLDFWEGSLTLFFLLGLWHWAAGVTNTTTATDIVFFFSDAGKLVIRWHPGDNGVVSHKNRGRVSETFVQESDFLSEPRFHLKRSLSYCVVYFTCIIIEKYSLLSIYLFVSDWVTYYKHMEINWVY